MAGAEHREPPEALAPGTRVEVLTDFDRSWSKGFVVEEATAGGYRLRRRSDSVVLPDEFPADQVREEHRSSMWWI